MQPLGDESNCNLSCMSAMLSEPVLNKNIFGNVCSVQLCRLSRVQLDRVSLSAAETQWVYVSRTVADMQLHVTVLSWNQGRNNVFRVGVQFLGLGYLSTEKIDRSTQFGTVGYIITLYSSKSYVKVRGPSKFLGPVPLPPVVAPMAETIIIRSFSADRDTGHVGHLELNFSVGCWQTTTVMQSADVHIAAWYHDDTKTERESFLTK